MSFEELRAGLEKPLKPGEWIARFSGRCGYCSNGISVGDLCRFEEDEAAHVKCAETPLAPESRPETCPECFLEKHSGDCW